MGNSKIVPPLRVNYAGNDLPLRYKMSLTGPGVVATDDPANNQTVLQIASGSGTGVPSGADREVLAYVGTTPTAVAATTLLATHAAAGFQSASDKTQSDYGLVGATNVTALRALAAPTTSPMRCRLTGYHTEGDGGGDLLYWDPASTKADDTGTVFKPNAVSSGSPGRWIRLVPDGEFNVLWFGAVPDALDSISPSLWTDNHAAFTAAVTAMGDTAPGTAISAAGVDTTTAKLGKKLKIPHAPGTSQGYYFLSDTWRINKSCHIYGAKGGSDHHSICLKFAAGKSGIMYETSVAWADAWFTNFNSPSDGGTSEASVLSDLLIVGDQYYGDHQQIWHPSYAVVVGQVFKATYYLDYGYSFQCTQAGTTGTLEPVWPVMSPPEAGSDSITDGTAKWKVVNAQGVSLVQGCICERVYVSCFPGNGFHLMGAATDSTPLCSLWKLINCKAANCGGSGLWILGNDANAGINIGFDAQGNWGYGIRDRSFLGNSHIGCHVAENVWGGYWGNLACFGCYTEGGQAPSSIHGSWLGPVDDGTGFTTFQTIPWSPHLTLTGPTYVMPTVRLPAPASDTGFCFYAESGTTGATEPDWRAQHTVVYPDNPYRFGLDLHVLDGTVDWVGLGDSTYSSGLIQGSGGATQTFTPIEFHAQQSLTGDTALYLGKKASNLGVIGWNAPGLDDRIWEMYFNPTTKYWQLVYGGGYDPLRLAGAQTPEGENAHNGANSHIVFPNGFYLDPNQLQGSRQYLTQATTVPTQDVWTVGDRVLAMDPAIGKPAGWTCSQAGHAGAPWSASSGFGPSNHCVPTTPNGHVYLSSGGNTGSSEPTWPTGSGATVTDGTITWTEAGAPALFTQWGTHGLVIDPTGATDGQVLAYQASSKKWLPATSSGGGGSNDGPHTPTLNSGVTNLGSPFAEVSYTKTPDGYVHLDGAVNTVGVDQVLFTLPTGFQPLATQILMVHSSNSGAAVPGRVDIDSSGVITVKTPAGDFLSLCGVSFPTF